VGPVYKTSSAATKNNQGRYVARRAGWDTHGLPVESRWRSNWAISRARRRSFEQVGVERVHAAVGIGLTFVGEFERLPRHRVLDATWSTRTHVPSGLRRIVVVHLQTALRTRLLYEDLKVIPTAALRYGLSSHG